MTTRVCALSDLDDRKPWAAEGDGVPVVLVRDGDVYVNLIPINGVKK